MAFRLFTGIPWFSFKSSIFFYASIAAFTGCASLSNKPNPYGSVTINNVQCASIPLKSISVFGADRKILFFNNQCSALLLYSENKASKMYYEDSIKQKSELCRLKDTRNNSFGVIADFKCKTMDFRVHINRQLEVKLSEKVFH